MLLVQSSYLTTFERSASPYVEVVDLYILLPRAMFLSPLRSNDRFAYGALSRGPRKFLICGESGGIERFQLAERVLCASIAERDKVMQNRAKVLQKMHIRKKCEQLFPKKIDLSICNTILLLSESLLTTQYLFASLPLTVLVSGMLLKQVV